MTGPGLVLSASTLVLPGVLTLRVDKRSTLWKTPAFFKLTVEGEGVLPTRRWVRAE